MEGVNKKYNLEIEVLTPLSIGAGAEKDWARGVDFVVDKGKLYKLNLKKMIANGIKVDDLTVYFATKNEKGLKAKLEGKLDAVSDFSMPFPAENVNDVKAFVKNQLSGYPILTGSSLKGSIRSVLLDYLATKEDINNAIIEAHRNRKPFESFIFGSSTNGDEFMRFIKISDAEFDRTELVNTKIFNLRGGGNNWQGGWKCSGNRTDAKYQPDGFNTLYESLIPEQKGYTSLLLSAEMYDKLETNVKKHVKSVAKSQILHDDIKTLFEIVNNHTKDYLLKEKSFFEKYQTDRTSEIIDSIEILIKQIPPDNSFCILKMSAGSGFHSITGDWQFDDYTKAPLDRKRIREGKVNPKSRKIAEYNNNLSLMGFVKLRVLREEEKKQIEHNRINFACKKENERLAILAEKRRKKEAEEQAVRLLKEKEKKYNSLLVEGEQLAKKQLYEKALTCYSEAKELFPDKDELAEIIADMYRHIQAEERDKLIEANKRQELEQRRMENAVPLSEKIAKAMKLPTLLGNVKQWMKQNEITTLSESEKIVLFQKIKEIVDSTKEKGKNSLKGQREDLNLIVGADITNQWIQDVLGQ